MRGIKFLIQIKADGIAKVVDCINVSSGKYIFFRSAREAWTLIHSWNRNKQKEVKRQQQTDLDTVGKFYQLHGTNVQWFERNQNGSRMSF